MDRISNLNFILLQVTIFSVPTASIIILLVEDPVWCAYLTKDILESEAIDCNIMIIDATETPIQKTKKRKTIILRRKLIHFKYKRSFRLKLNKYSVHP